MTAYQNPTIDAVLESAEASPRAPEILAPAGGREQFFAALNAGADAVFLGLKAFNARSRAENFTADDLRELVPLAHRYGMKVLVTLNVLVKDAELEALIDTLSVLEEIEVDAAIVQDLGVVRIARRHFPHLRLHASTQMAVHNLAGVREAARLGLKRVVLARELTALELKKIRASVPRDAVEIEAFCHGSLCYSYSGLCFFSGAQDARSGNRGECAYTCRQPYKILNEPGHGFLFSMKDLSTADDLKLLVDAGIDTLKIEGRKKDAQYVGTVVKIYRQKLDETLGRGTLRPDAPTEARTLAEGEGPASLARDLALSFHRDTTRFFLKGRYDENVIDLDNPTHKGIRAGVVIGVSGRVVRVNAEIALERFDGLRVDSPEATYHAKPQHGDDVKSSASGLAHRYRNEVIQFSLREMRVDGIKVPVAAAGAIVDIELPEGVATPRVGDIVHKTRSDDLKRRTERMTHVPAGAKLRALRYVDVSVAIDADGPEVVLTATVSKQGSVLCRASLTAPKARPTGASDLESELRDLLGLFGNAGMIARAVAVQGDARWFVPRSRLKALKSALVDALPAAYEAHVEKRRTCAQAAVKAEGRARLEDRAQARLNEKTQWAVKIDRLEYLETLASFCADAPAFDLTEIVFEPKRAFLDKHSPESMVERLVAFGRSHGVKIRLAFPTVIRAWDEPLLRVWFSACAAAGITAFELGNLGTFELLRTWDLKADEADLASDFTLYSLNNQATRLWCEMGVSTVSLSIEDDVGDLRSHLARWPWEQAAPQAILYKDTPLFIAESCSLTALHNGCPTSKVCGYRTLEVENDEGERFFVAHENCKSIVYGKEAFSLTHRRAALEELGVRRFRLDFLTRPYSPSDMCAVLDAALGAQAVPGTHTANFDRALL